MFAWSKIAVEIRVEEKAIIFISSRSQALAKTGLEARLQIKTVI
jgi:hypothetical protein